MGLEGGAPENHDKGSGGMDDTHARLDENKYPDGAFD